MARRPRLQLRGAIYHAMSRGNNKSDIFVDDDDREAFLRIAAEAFARYEVRCFAMCLMSNHYHFVLNTPRGNISLAMRYVNGVYTQHYNRRHARTGHVFEGRFTSVLVDNDYYLRTALAYVVLNPVKANRVDDVAIWKWSSYRWTAGLTPAPSFLTLDWMDFVFGGRTRAESIARYREYIRVSQSELLGTGLEVPVVGVIDFNREIRAHIGATMHQAALPRFYRSLARPPLEDLFRDVANKHHRAQIIQRAHIIHGYRLAEIARCLNLHPNSVSRILGALRRQSASRAQNAQKG